MAAGWLHNLAGDRIRVLSSGTEPADQVNPVPIQAIAEVGIDITAAQPRLLTPELVQDVDVVVTMGCGDTCLYFPGKRYEDWPLTDPAGQALKVVRKVRDEIHVRVDDLIDPRLPGG